MSSSVESKSILAHQGGGAFDLLYGEGIKFGILGAEYDPRRDMIRAPFTVGGAPLLNNVNQKSSGRRRGGVSLMDGC